MLWFLPVAVGIGLISTQTALKARRLHKPGTSERASWWYLVLGWFPLLCWILAQVVVQD
jgi:uncharacterized membrane protein YhaH (DUF805 family)